VTSRNRKAYQASQRVKRLSNPDRIYWIWKRERAKWHARWNQLNQYKYSLHSEYRPAWIDAKLRHYDRQARNASRNMYYWVDRKNLKEQRKKDRASKIMWGHSEDGRPVEQYFRGTT
jgi:hypothetical protein